MRKYGSARFDPYYKVQFWNVRNHSWQDVQRSFETAEAAEEALIVGRVSPPRGCSDTHRLMYITESGREPVAS